MAIETSTANNSASPETGGTGNGGAAPIERMFADVGGSSGEARGEKPQERRSEREPQQQQPQRRERVEPEPDGEEGDEPDDDDLDDLGTGDKPKPKDDEDDDGEEADDEEGAEPESDDEDPEIDLDGKGTKVKLSEMKTGYLRQADYTRKTTELAADRDTVFTYAKEMKADRDALLAQAENLNALALALQPSKEVWEQLKAGDPKQYIAAQEEWGKVEATRAKIIQAAKDALGQGNANAERERNLFVQGENAKLKEIMPAIFDPKKGPAIQERIFKYGERTGYTREELQGAVDHREIMTLWKAMRYDEIKGTAPKPKGEKRSERTPAPVQGNRAPQRQTQPARGIVRQQSEQKDRRKAAEAALRRSGSVEDAAMVFSNM